MKDSSQRGPPSDSSHSLNKAATVSRHNEKSSPRAVGALKHVKGSTTLLYKERGRETTYSLTPYYYYARLSKRSEATTTITLARSKRSERLGI
jgi:hypothetical protein